MHEIELCIVGMMKVAMSRMPDEIFERDHLHASYALRDHFDIYAGAFGWEPTPWCHADNTWIDWEHQIVTNDVDYVET